MTDGSYNDVFPGGPVQPANASYREFSLAANLTLVWPSLSQDSADVATDIMRVSPTTSGLAIRMPPADQVSVGETALFVNPSANSFEVQDQAGNLICTVAAGTSWFVYLRTNATVNGTWGSLQYGASASAANAADLAGLGLVAIAGMLNTQLNATLVNSNTTIVASDRASAIVWGGGAGTLAITACSTLTDGWFAAFHNNGSGAVVLDPSGSDLVDGAATLTLNPNESCFLVTDGLNLYSIGLGRSITVTVTRLVKSVAGAANVTLTSSEAANELIEFTGLLTGNIQVIVPNTVQTYHIFNNTTGAFSLTLITAAGTGIVVTQGTRQLLDCDGTNVVIAQSTTAGTVTSIATGTGLTGGPITTTGTISLANTAVTPGSYGNATNVAAITVDAQGRLTAAANVAISVGTVTSVAMTVPAFLSVAGSPITTTGTLAVTLATQAANLVFAGPASGAAATPTFRALAGGDFLVSQAIKYSRTTFSTVPTGTIGIIPIDNSIPQISEGTEIFTAAYTPLFAASNLMVKGLLYFSFSSNFNAVIALFRDATADAIGVNTVPSSASWSDKLNAIEVWAYVPATAAVSTTISLRLGSTNAVGYTVNGILAGRIFGGLLASTIEIWELKG